LASGTFEICESGGRLTPLPPVSWEVRGAPEKPLLHVWAENCNVTRRVLAITDQSAERMALAVERFGKSQPQRLDLVRLEFERSAKKISREGYCEQLRRILAEQIPTKPSKKSPSPLTSSTLSPASTPEAFPAKGPSAVPSLRSRREKLPTASKVV